jgi:hypothetical protein
MSILRKKSTITEKLRLGQLKRLRVGFQEPLNYGKI